MTAYHVTATREGRYWVLDIEGVGATQARHLAEFDVMIKDYVRLDLGPEAVEDINIILTIRA